MAISKKINLKFLKKQKHHFIVFLIFVLFLLLLPRISQIITPCLTGMEMSPSNYEDCNLVLVLDNFMILSFAGMFILDGLMIMFKPFSKRGIVILNLFMALAIIVAYYSYISVAWETVSTSQIYLDSLN